MNPRSLIRQVIDQYRDAPLVWGQTDCLFFCNDCAKALTGLGPAEALRGTYSDEAGALAVIAAHNTLAGLVASLVPEIPVAQAKDGDWGLIPHDDVETLGVVVGAFVIARTQNSLSSVLRRYMTRAFRVS